MSQFDQDRTLCALSYTLCRLKNDGPFTGVRFSALISPSGGDFSLDDTAVCVNVSGIYLVRYSVFLPEGSELDTVFSLLADETTLLSSVVHIIRRPADPGATYSAQALAKLEAPVRVFLTASAAIDVCDDCASTAASMSLLRIG